MTVASARLKRDIVLVQKTGARHVGLLPPVHTQFEAIDERWRAALKQRFEYYGIPGKTMPREQFNNEGKHVVGNKPRREVQLWAFKAFQHRLYGAILHLDGIATFAGAVLIEDKKRNRADPAVLRKAAGIIAGYID